MFGRQVHPPDGEGYSLDLQLVWRPDTQLTASLTVKDLVGRIDWRNTPRTRATASSDVKEYDENGYVIYRPVLSGYESNEDFTQILPRKSSLLVSYRVLPTTRLVTRIYHTPAVTLTQVGADYQLRESTQVQLLYMLDAGAVTLGYRQGKFLFAVMSDSTEFSNAHTFGLDLSYLYKF